MLITKTYLISYRRNSVYVKECTIPLKHNNSGGTHRALQDIVKSSVPIYLKLTASQPCHSLKQELSKVVNPQIGKSLRGSSAKIIRKRCVDT